ncbi:amidohydrolase family protein [Anaerobacillus sp. CMMVII]|uniref:amidohydrolase family protein n=1 Tax=Anaerobacillus sp. CMMVII TaxID=2755588 RepID=UPI0021B7A5B9|nr:amidohydrolase family protein [Anaerobacillus sp. CMMVII]MCT8137932.1 amidohydrolase family protein [Anaerobacillus sp. CMMVII]
MKIIDAHMHFSKIESFQKTAKDRSHIDYTYEGLLQEYRDANVVLGIGMGVTEQQLGGFPDSSAPTPMGLDMLKDEHTRIVYCPGVNPYSLGTAELLALEAELTSQRVVGIKIYLGYYPYYAYDKIYGPVYELAAAYNVPVVFHCGDTYSERGLLKYSHPLTLDEVAVQNRNVTFMMAHFGDPWVLDGAEVVYKNSNMYADLSGLIVGDRQEVKRISNTPHFYDHLRHAITFCDHYEKLLFGTDWPLVQVQPYIEFIKTFIPDQYVEDVFYNNALKVFPKLKSFLE